MSSDRLGAGMMDFRYDYDWAGEVVTKSENGDATSYGYDGAGQLTSESSLDAAGDPQTTSYAYDAAGNRTSVTTPSASQTYARGDGSGSGVDGNRYGTDGVWNFFYDGHTNATSAGEGNLTKKAKIGTSEAWTYEYDNRNHLIKAEHTTNGSLIDFRVDYVYDANGNRVKSVRDANGGYFGDAVVTWYTLDGENPARMPEIGLENVDVWAETTDSGSLTTRYMHGDGVDQLLGRWDASGSGSGQFWILTDNLGSVRGVISTGGTLLDAIKYNAFGNIIAETNAIYRGNIGFTGGQFDATTGFVSHHVREYDPKLGRWITQDPVRFVAGDANLYRYVSNKVANTTDPSGLFGRGDADLGLPDWRARARAQNAGEDTGPTRAGDLRMYGSDGNRTAFEAMGEAGRGVQHLAVTVAVHTATPVVAGAALRGAAHLGTRAVATVLQRVPCPAAQVLPIIRPFIGCFAAGTHLRAPEGSRPIEAIQSGDWVLSSSEDHDEGVIVPRQVLQTTRRIAEIVILRIGGRGIRTTTEHPFWAKGKGWIGTTELIAGDRVRSHDGQWIEVQGWQQTGKFEEVFNLEVDADHTYFIGEGDWGFSVWAHNQCTAAQLTANSAQGRAAQSNILARLMGNRNVTVLGTQVRVRTPGNPNFRVIDILVQNNRTGQVFIVEVKSGGAVVSASQAAKDASIAIGGSPSAPTVFFGRAAGGLENTPTGAIPTYVARVP